MNKDQHSFGFNKNSEQTSTPWDDYIGGEPHQFYNSHGAYVSGVLQEINKNEGHALFQPSVVFNMDCSKASINYDKPTRIPLPLGLIRPFPKGTNLQDFVNEFNQKKEEERQTRMPPRESNIIVPRKGQFNF